MKLKYIFLTFVFFLQLSVEATSSTEEDLVVTLDIVPLSCEGEADASISIVNVIGGSGNYVYEWSDGSDGESISNLEAGMYSLTVSEIVEIDTFYLETFEPNTGQDWELNVESGTNEPDANTWVQSSAEGGLLPPACANGDNGNYTLHIQNLSMPNDGATYNAGGLCDFGISCVTTNKRTASPNISTLGLSNLTLSFDFIGNGDGLNDNASLWYSINAGTSWMELDSSLKSDLCGTIGQWTNVSYNLPVDCENIENLKLAFNWTNNDDNVGTDPSFAADNVLMTSAEPACSTTVTVMIEVAEPLDCSDGDCDNGLEIWNAETCACDTDLPVLEPNQPTIFGETEVCENGTYVYTLTPDPNTLEYIWEMPNNETFTNLGESIEIDWTGSTGGDLCVMATNGCDTTFATCLLITIGGGLATPIVICENSDANSASISWEAVGGAINYLVNYVVNGGLVESETTTDNLFVVDNLNIGDEVNFMVTAQSDGACLDSPPSIAISCVVENCPSFTFNLDSLPTLICNTDTSFYLPEIIQASVEEVVGGPVSIDVQGAGIFEDVLTITGLGMNETMDITITNLSSNCVYFASHTYSVLEQVVANAGIDQSLGVGGTLQLDGSNSIGEDFLWTTQDGNIVEGENTSNPTIDGVGTYELTVSTSNDCISKDEVIITLTLSNNWVKLPAAFSPNGDGLNEPLRALGNGIETIKWMIFNRWGEKVFESDNLDIGWDGTHKGQPAPVGVYVYVGEVVFVDGMREEFLGNVVLVR